MTAVVERIIQALITEFPEAQVYPKRGYIWLDLNGTLYRISLDRE